MAEPLRIGILAGEASGDNLASGLMAALRRRLPVTQAVEFVGVGGDRMLAQGLESLAPMGDLSVNGFREPLLRLPALLRLLRRLRNEMVERQVHAFIGVDFNVFNFLLEGALKRRGIPTVHYVSPSVYAWRRGRTRRVGKVADLLLCLFPFEPGFYAGEPLQAEFVGHPLADAIDMDAGSLAAREVARDAIAIPHDVVCLALLPGSRGSEVKLMLAEFLRAAELFHAAQPVRVVIPCPSAKLADLVRNELASTSLSCDVTVDENHARRALLACDVALVKSGTSTLECMLLKRPMVVSYRLGGVTYQIVRRLIRSPYVALPNILAQRALVPELLQDAATAENLSDALLGEWRSSTSQADYLASFAALHVQLRCDADGRAADAVVRLLGIGGTGGETV
ncbi:MAG: lipid-A-disaccharide synthase [Pseudomonadota bacterium]